MSEKEPTILLSAVGGMPSLGVIEKLQSQGVRVIGVDADAYSFGLQYLDASYVVPRGDDPEFVTELLQIVRSESIDALLLSPESEVLAVAEHRDRFLSIGCLPLCPSLSVAERCADKRKTNNHFEKLGIPTPQRYDTRADAEFPCIVKPRFGRGGSGVSIAETPEELDVYAEQLDDPIIQEFCEGTEYTVDVLTEEDGEVLSVVPRKRIGVQSGKSVTGKTVTNENIREYCRRIASSWGLYGPSCIQCIKDDDGLKFIEVNTRFGGGAILSMHADEELIPNLLRMINEKPTQRSDDYKTGVVMLRNYTQMFVDRSDIERYEQ